MLAVKESSCVLLVGSHLVCLQQMDIISFFTNVGCLMHTYIQGMCTVIIFKGLPQLNALIIQVLSKGGFKLTSAIK